MCNYWSLYSKSFESDPKNNVLYLRPLLYLNNVSILLFTFSEKDGRKNILLDMSHFHNQYFEKDNVLLEVLKFAIFLFRMLLIEITLRNFFYGTLHFGIFFSESWNSECCISKYFYRTKYSVFFIFIFILIYPLFYYFLYFHAKFLIFILYDT